MMSAAGHARISRSPFTPTQWQELEHQALIYKHILSGIPIPPELIYSMRRSLDSSLASRLIPHQPIGWSCYQVGFGKKADPEPGRCRRTDGKKWRCSREAYPDSKYCERHMHRGRNRSRKPMETSNTTSSTNTSQISTPPPSPSVSAVNNRSNLSISTNFSSTLFSTGSLGGHDAAYNTTNLASPRMSSTCFSPSPYHYSYPYSSSRPPDSGLSLQNPVAHLNVLDSGSCSHAADKNFRYIHGMREGVDERALFPEASGSRTVRGFHDPSSYQPLTESSSYKGYSPINEPQQYQQTFAETIKGQQEQHCFVLGTDMFKSTGSVKLEKDEDESKRPLHHFFEEWPPKTADSWLDLAPNSRLHTDT